MSKQPQQQSQPRRLITVEEIDATSLQRIQQRLGDLSTAYSVVKLLEENPALQSRLPGLYLEARGRISRNQDWYRLGRFAGQLYRDLCDVGGRIAHRVRKMGGRAKATTWPPLSVQ
ncbi:hypothetical protein [Chitinimonas koreensis]|uniref:hypothetical protein n=1 Tax=Chitinimonas koreensis TaxID=356302 RepID=UPI00049034CB|nr:hypothetical protein [Chitinimonas koreensis]QNM95503.1 hypothetical protein H9L41_16755 [Chitinimonas koreensis]